MLDQNRWRTVNINIALGMHLNQQKLKKMQLTRMYVPMHASTLYQRREVQLVHASAHK